MDASTSRSTYYWYVDANVIRLLVYTNKWWGEEEPKSLPLWLKLGLA